MVRKGGLDVRDRVWVELLGENSPQYTVIVYFKTHECHFSSPFCIYALGI
jgi:hypothetical protein